MVYGGRNYSHYGRVASALLQVKQKHGKFVLVHGCASGADTLGARWALIEGCPVQPFPADWMGHGKAAGPIRNQKMVDSGLDGAVEFPGGFGTADMRRRLEAAGVPIWRPKWA